MELSPLASDAGLWSILPPLLAILLALLTKEVVFSLFVGVLAGIGETTLAFDLDGGQNFTIFYEPCFPGRADHGGRGAFFELACCGDVYHVDDRDGRPAGGWHAIPIRLYPGRHHVTLRLRSDLWAPAGHRISVRFRVTPE